MTGSPDRLDTETGLYIHWPFCLSKCPYCDFNSHVVQQVDHQRWQKALLKELSDIGERIGPRRLSTIFFGGGTPSLMAPETVAALVEEVRSAHWRSDEDLEITLEANPTSVEADKFRAFHEAGVNRVSIGVQSLNDEALAFLGRKHSAQEAINALEIARNIFPNVSIDLIYARPDHSVRAWADELNRAVDLGTDHLSLYQLTIEPQTKFHTQYEAGLFALPNEDVSAELFLHTQDLCAERGRPAYEISNHARPGHQCRHNMIYWSGQDYIGIGPGAHGRVTVEGRKFATENVKPPGQWLESIESNGIDNTRFDAIPMEQQADECLVMGLRLVDGLDLERLKRLGMAPTQSSLHPLQQEGLIVQSGNNLRVTDKGRLLLNWIIGQIDVVPIPSPND